MRNVNFSDELERLETKANTYRHRALCLRRKLRRDTAHEKAWDATMEVFTGMMHEKLDLIGVPRTTKPKDDGNVGYLGIGLRLDLLTLGWIRADLQPPPIMDNGLSEDVLVLTEHDHAHTAYMDVDGCWWDNVDNHDLVDEVTHWRPIPPRPRNIPRSKTNDNKDAEV